VTQRVIQKGSYRSDRSQLPDKLCLRSSPITHFATSSPKQHGLMKYSFGSAMLKAVLSNVTTVLISEFIDAINYGWN
jgi:hypothetical protein